MKIFTLLLVPLALFINAGSALECYHCNSTVDRCIEGGAGVEVMPCGLERPPTLQFCIAKVVMDKKTLIETAISTCVLQEKPLGRQDNKDIPVPEEVIVLDVNIKQCQSDENHEVKYCNPCPKDLCNVIKKNSAPTYKLNFFVVLYFPILYLFTKCNLS